MATRCAKCGRMYKDGGECKFCADIEGQKVRRAGMDMALISLRVQKMGNNAGLSPGDYGMEKWPEDWKPGDMMLYPEDWENFFNGQKQDIHNIVNHWSLKAGDFLPNVKIVPKKKVGEIVDELIEARQSYLNYAKEFSELLPAIKAAKAARHSGTNYWERIKNKYPDSPQEVISKFKVSWMIFDFAPSGDGDMDLETLGAMSKEQIQYIRAKLLEGVKKVQERVNAGDVVTDKGLESLAKVVDWYETMNVFGSGLLDAELAKLKSQLSTVDKEQLEKNNEVFATFEKTVDGIMAFADNVQDAVDVAEGYIRGVEF